MYGVNCPKTSKLQTQNVNRNSVILCYYVVVLAFQSGCNNNNNNTFCRMSSSDASNSSLHIKPSNEACHQLHPRLGTFGRGKIIPCRKHKSKTKSAMCLGFYNTKIWVKIWQNMSLLISIILLCTLTQICIPLLEALWLVVETDKKRNTRQNMCKPLLPRPTQLLSSLTTLGLILSACKDSHVFWTTTLYPRFGKLSSVILRPWSDLKNGQGKCPSIVP